MKYFTNFFITVTAVASIGCDNAGVSFGSIRNPKPPTVIVPPVNPPSSPATVPPSPTPTTEIETAPELTPDQRIILSTEDEFVSVSIFDINEPVTGCVAVSSLPIGIYLDAISCTLTGSTHSDFSGQYFEFVGITTSGLVATKIELQSASVAPSIVAASTLFELEHNKYIEPIRFQNNSAQIAVNGCSSTPELPNGLSLNPDTCEITGRAHQKQAPTFYTVIAQNSHGVSYFEVQIGVHKKQHPIN